LGEPTPDSAAKRTRRKAVSFSFLIQTPDRPARGNHCQPIGLIRHADDTHQLAEHGFAHSRFPGRGGVAGDAICTAIGDAHGEIDHLFRQRIERARRHDFFHARPGAREQRRIVRQIFPEIIDVIDLPRPLDVIEHGADLRTGVAVLDRAFAASFSPLRYGSSVGRRLSQAGPAGTIAASKRKRQRAT